jgi:two-component system phosphate regulon response regulator OmpR
LGIESDILERRDIHLLVVDDDNRIRDLLKSYLSRQGFRISVAGNAVEARHLIANLAFDLIILDVMMPGEDGVSLTRSLRDKDDVPIILLTAKAEASDRIEGLRSGADDYLPKPFEPEELVLRIEAIFRRLGTTAPASQVRFGPWEYDLARLTLTKDGERVRLTTGEEALLTLLARMGGAPVSRYALSEKIRAKSERAVDVQMTRLRRKIEDNPSEPTFLLTVRGHGYRLLTDTPA